VERNALRANLVARAEDWRCGSLWRRELGTPADRRWLGNWPLPRPRRWQELVNEPQTEAELEGLRRSVVRGRPFGGEPWIEEIIQPLGLEYTLRPRGRPRKQPPDST
jgi:putative transposase